jgi:hypothetical protein
MANEKYKITKPHKKNYLTTPFGRMVERISYFQLFELTLLIWLISSTYFYFSTFHDNGMNIDFHKTTKLDLAFSAMYFSGVTITTLGYGDILPCGFGRVVSVFTAIGGLTVIAVLISKISSERQSSILLLLHTSDIERRMSEFTNDIELGLMAILKNNEEKNINLLNDELKKLRALIEIIDKYMLFHINQSFLLEIGADSAIKRLLLKLSECQDVLLQSRPFMITNERTESLSLSISKKISVIELMLLTHNKVKGSRLDNLDSHNLTLKHNSFYGWLNTVVTEKKIHLVQLSLPKEPRQNWPKHIHKQIAHKLELSNNMVEKCIDELKARNWC